MNILNIKNKVIFDDSITNIQYHAYSPYTTSFNNNDEIRIAIQHQDLYVLPHDSFIYIEGEIQIEKETSEARLVNNAAAFLFDEIRYELNNFEVDRCKNVGISSSIKGYTSYSPNDMHKMRIASWNLKEDGVVVKNMKINFCVPLKSLLGFAEDYQNILLNAKHEIILVRSRNDINLFIYDSSAESPSLKVNKIQWRIPHVQVSDMEKLKLLKIIEKKESISLHYRQWELYEYPMLPETNKHMWAVKSSTNMNRPRFIIIGFQSNRNNIAESNASKFDHCNLNDIKVYLNSDCYPYENIHAEFDKSQYALFYEMYMKFQEKYYLDKNSTPLLSYEDFSKTAPLFVIDCSRQNESLKNSIVDIRVAMQFSQNITKNTTAYCLIMHDNHVTYNPYTNIVYKQL